LEIADVSNFSDDKIEFINENSFYEFETVFRKKDSSLCNAQVVIKLIELHGKSFLQITIRDITLRKQFYLELLAQKNRFKELFDASPVALVILNSSLEILELNPAFSVYFGYNINEVPNLKTLTQIAFDDDDYRTYVINATKISLLEAKDKHGRFATPTFKIRCKDGQNKYIQLTGSILGDGYIVAFSDLTESVNYEKSLRGLNEKLSQRVEEEIKKRLASEQTLIQSEKMAQLGNMIGIILHQWKQPLSAISLFAQELRIACKFNDIDIKLVQSNALNIISQVDFMTKTADEFQDFYKPSKEKRNFFVKNQIEIIGSILSKQLSLASIDFIVSGDDTLTAHGFDSEFKQVILNIINNAKDAIVEKKIQNPFIKVSILKPNSNIVIQIEDNAGGILSELLPDKLFEPFVSTKEEHGTGVGLSLCKTIITEHFHGELTATNGAFGAIFTISIPC
jgi:PAS domain S-box-containing protein